MIAFEDRLEAEPGASRGLLPGYNGENPPLSSISQTIRKDDDIILSSSYTETGFKLSQCFGDCSRTGEATQDSGIHPKRITKQSICLHVVLGPADILTTVEFDFSGDFLASGDRGGRVVIFKKSDDEQPKAKENSSGTMCRIGDFEFFTEFQSHEAEFDYLKSLEIQGKINAIKWCPRVNDALFVLSTNDKTVKLWKVREKEVKKVACAGRSPISEGRDMGTLVIPNVSVTGTAVTTSVRRVFANGHTYHVNSIDPCSDGEHFISADDLRINLWNLEVTDRSFNILDVKPRSMEELTEVITAATFHPSHCHVFLYSSSRGCMKMGDMRAAALCDQHAKVLDSSSDPSTKSFFSEIVGSISDIKTTRDGRYIASRDYMTLKLWDVNMEARPLKIINVHEHLRPKAFALDIAAQSQTTAANNTAVQSFYDADAVTVGPRVEFLPSTQLFWQLCYLYDNDYIFDKFECAISGDASVVATGTYSSKCIMYDRNGQPIESLEVSYGQLAAVRFFADGNGKSEVCKDVSRKQRGTQGKKAKRQFGPDNSLAPDAGGVDFENKILHMSWQPKDNDIAITGKDKLYIYTSS